MENIGPRIYQFHTYKEAVNKYISELINKHILQISVGSPRYEIFDEKFRDDLKSDIKVIQKNISGYELELNLDENIKINKSTPFTLSIKKSILNIIDNIEGIVYENRIIIDNIIPHLDLSVPRGLIKNISIFEIYWDQLLQFDDIKIGWLSIKTNKKKISFESLDSFKDFLKEYIKRGNKHSKNYVKKYDKDTIIMYCYYRNLSAECWYKLKEIGNSFDEESIKKNTSKVGIECDIIINFL
jgi:hypothetical protein